MRFFVMPAKAGIQYALIPLMHVFWTPAFAGVTGGLTSRTAE